jgi:hypothetical protein
MARRTLHPKKHKWSLRGDFVDKRDNRGIVMVDRIDKCDHCPRHRARKWNIRRWEKAGSFRYYGENVPMDERVSEAQAAEAEFREANPNLTFREKGSE